MRSRRVVVLAGVLALVVLWIVTRRQASKLVAEPTAIAEPQSVFGESEAPAPARRPRAEPPARSDVRHAFELGASIRIPPPSAAGEAPVPNSVPTHHPRALAPGSGRFVDRREDAGSDDLMSEIPKRTAEVRAAASRCLDGWAEEDPSIAAGIMLVIKIDEQGLQEVSIKDRAEAPRGALACLTNAVYPVDWGGLTKKLLMVTVKVGYARDAGADPVP
jgi:hypothetical protein